MKTNPEFLLKGLSATRAHQLAEQSAIWNLFAEIGNSIAQNLTQDAATIAGDGLPLFAPHHPPSDQQA